MIDFPRNVPARSLLTVLAAAALLTGCGQSVLDFRNAAISGGKVYAGGGNEPFTGKLTNVPLTKLPVAALKPLTDLTINITRNQQFAAVFLLDGLGALMGNAGGLVCDVQIRKGAPDGKAECHAGDYPLLEFAYEGGVVDGKALVYDTEHKGAVVAEAKYSKGLLEGGSKVTSAKTGKVLHRVSWKAGVSQGKEEMFDENGHLVFSGTIVDGKYDGEAIRFNADGSVAEKTMYVRGVPRQEKASAEKPNANDTNVEACVDKWITAYRAEKGQDELVRNDQMEEWRAACRNGKQP